MLAFHDLLGPSRIYQKIVSDLQEGKSCVLQVPARSRCQALDSIEEFMKRSKGREWTPVYVTTGNLLDALTERFVSNTAPGDIPTKIHELYKSTDFRGGVIVPLYEEGTVTIDENIPFLNAFAHYTRNNISPLKQSPILFVVETGRKPIFSSSDPLLTVKVLDDMVQPCDMVYWAHIILHTQTTKPPLNRMLHAETAASIALWDEHLCNMLCDAPLRQIGEPWDILEEIATEHGWYDLLNNVNSDDMLWQAGIWQTYNGQRESHSSYLSITAQKESVVRRIWQAQLSVLFPFIEQCRKVFIQKYRNKLSPAASERRVGGMNKEVEVDDLEIGQIHHQLAGTKLSHNDHQFLASLHNARNHLAHNQTVQQRDLDCLLQ